MEFDKLVIHVEKGTAPPLHHFFDNQLWKMERPKFQVENPRRKYS